MRMIVLALLLAAAWAQAPIPQVAPDEAAKHILTAPPAPYPPMAEQARIQGDVILELQIDESGTPINIGLVRGHPMLATAAIEAVRQWRYRPFEADGKAVRVKTYVVVTFGHGVDEQARKDLNFVIDLRTASDRADVAVDKHDFAEAERQLSHAGDLIVSRKEMQNGQERWHWLIATGRLRALQQKYDEADHYFGDALSLSEKASRDKNAPEVGTTLAIMASVSDEEKRFDLAHEYAQRSFAIYQKSFKATGSNNPGAQQAYAHAAGLELLLLMQIANQRKDAADLAKQCREAQDFEHFISVEERDRLASACKGTAPTGQ